MNATARESVRAPAPASALDDLMGAENDPRGRRSKLDLIAESRRIREECNDLVRLYQEALDTRRSQRFATPESGARMPTPQQGANSAAWRKKALLLLLIEELV